MKDLSTMDRPKKPELTYLDPRRTRFFWSGATLRFTVQDEYSCLKTAVRRIFPLSMQDRYLSICDSDNKELGILIDPERLDAESRRAIGVELERRYVVPEVLRILRAKERFGTVEWSVETDRGPHTFTTRDLRRTAVRLSDSRYLLKDTDDSRYHIPDITRLDSRSRTLLHPYL